ncbi:MAG: putative sulfate exporter family transporter [Nitrospirae bacterium]|nr:putative sulfate exporter family transporter [Nitrospirota bacterium]
MNVRTYMPGFLVIVVIASFSLYISSLHASFDALVISIIIGMLLGNSVGNRDYFGSGLNIGVKALLPIGIALYGMQLSISGIRPGLAFSIVLVFCLLFIFTFILARVFRLNNSISLLLASGLSICGMIFYPLIYDFFPISTDDYNFFAGTTLPMIGQVRVAASHVGTESLESALQIKLIRVAFLLFLVPGLVLRQYRLNKQISIPWFVIIFISLSVLINMVPAIRQLQETASTIGTSCFSAGLAAIGFSVDFDAIIEEGMTPLGVIFAVWSAVLIVIYLFRNIV